MQKGSNLFFISTPTIQHKDDVSNLIDDEHDVSKYNNTKSCSHYN